MSKDWWPAKLAHIPEEKLWDDDQVIVSEVKSFDEQPLAGYRRTIAVLIHVDQIAVAQESFADLSNEVIASGPNPVYDRHCPYKPEFWVEQYGHTYAKYEPLVFSWSSHRRTVLQPDPGFLMTYGLIPRQGNGGFVHWDDPQLPRRDVVTVSPPSLFDFPFCTPAFVSIARDVLQDYLTLRHLALVQAYFEERWANIDAETAERLGDQESVEIDFADRRVWLHRHSTEDSTINAQVSGGRLIAQPGGLPISTNPLSEGGLLWPGIDVAVNNDVARKAGITCVYVDDSVLAHFELRPEYTVCPESGSVSHGTQWTVSARRVGRNILRLELKHLYEGVPPEITRHWHKFAVSPVPNSAYPAILEDPNIGKRAKGLTFGVVGLGTALSALAKAVGLAEVSERDFVNMSKSDLDYNGWWTTDTTAAIARHIPFELSSDEFLDRCMSLNKIIVENLSQKWLRKTLHKIGVPSEAIKEFGSLKLLDQIVQLTQLADNTGLDISNDGVELWKRLQGTVPEQPLARLFAIYEVRNLRAHKASLIKTRLEEKLACFGMAPGEAGGRYGKVLDRIYDQLIADLRNIARMIAGAF